MLSKPFSVDPKNVVDILKSIRDPFSEKSIVEAELIDGVHIDDNKVTISLKIPHEKVADYKVLQQEIHDEVAKISNVVKVMIIMTQHKTDPNNKFSSKLSLPEIKHVIAVASGKGGVGKSLVALNLALALRDKGQQVGILDADIYGPSLAKMLNLNEKPEVNAEKRITPLKKFGLQCMSMAFFIPEETPVIWRGPMIQNSLLQFVRDVNWQGLDILIIDLPPGTGDVQLTLVQKIPLSGAVIVSTPQDLALIDARKALAMFQKLHIPILGIVENMSYFSCPQCHHRTDIFHHGGARVEAKNLAVPFLGEIPLTIKLRQCADEGSPFVETYPDHALTEIFLDMAENVLHQIENGDK